MEYIRDTNFWSVVYTEAFILEMVFKWYEARPEYNSTELPTS